MWLDLFRTILASIIVAVLGHAIWAHNTIRSHDHTLYGPKGTNGLKKSVEDLEDRVNKIERDCCPGGRKG